MSKYLYREWKLPPLPSWNKKTHPVALLVVPVTVGIFSMASLYVLPELKVESNGIPYKAGETMVSSIYLAYPDKVSTETQWPELTEVEEHIGTDGKPIALSLAVSNVKWTNTDIYWESGNLYLAASYPIDPETGGEIRDYDPVPVSPVQINPALLTQGFFVGQALRRSRGK